LQAEYNKNEKNDEKLPTIIGYDMPNGNGSGAGTDGTAV
jgi:hypothetical protein